MKAFVTGATGFLGSYIVDHLIARGDDVTVLVRQNSNLDYLHRYPQITFVYGGLTSREVLTQAMSGIDVVYHSAARSADWGTWPQFYETNFLGTATILEACLKANVKRLVYVSSPSVVFHYTDQIDIDESYPYPKEYANFYSKAKGEAEKLVLAANNQQGLTTVTLRPHAIWGPRDLIGFIPRILARVKKGRMIRVGQTDPIVDLCYVTNAAEACVLAGESTAAAGKVYFITDGQPVRIWDFIPQVCDIFGLTHPNRRVNEQMLNILATVLDMLWKIPYIAENYEPFITRYSVGILSRSTTYKIDAARRDLGYNPKISPEEGLKNLKQWVDQIGGLDAFLRHVQYGAGNQPPTLLIQKDTIR
jgi:nucleoside-diphosphate-sugar epimerase